MEAPELKFCGHSISTEDLTLVKELAEEFWGISRTELPSTRCELLFIRLFVRLENGSGNPDV